MFIQFTKINTAHPTITSPLMVNSADIMQITTDRFQNVDTGIEYIATRVDVIGHPVYSFHTLSTINQINVVLPMVNVTGGAGTGGSCVDPSSLDIVYPQAVFPHIRLLSIFNSSLSTTEEHVINPNHLVWAEDMMFYDRISNQQETALLVTLRDTPPRRILSTLLYSDLAILLAPASI